MSNTTITFIDRSKCKRVKQMKVICPGLPRTGTNSLRRALQILGFDATYHGFEPWFENTRDFEMWTQALNAKFKGKGKPFGREEFDKLLGHCEATTDMPTCIFHKELIEAYPEAKIVVTRRAVEAWYESVLTVLYPNIGIPRWFDLFVPLVPSYSVARRGGRLTWQCLFGPNFPETGRQTYEKHYADLEQSLPKDRSRVLEFDVTQGWEPLCKFLDVPIPEEPFPRGNDMAALKVKILTRRHIMVREAVRNVSLIVGGVAVAATAYVKFVHRK